MSVPREPFPHYRRALPLVWGFSSPRLHSEALSSPDPLAPYSSQGIGLILFGNFAACLIIALTSGYHGAIAGLSPTLVVLMASLGTKTINDGDARFATTVAALILSAVGTGMCCFLIGRFRIANLVRFIPYPVAGGFVAGIGGMVLIASISLMGAEPDQKGLQGLLETSVLWVWVPGVLFGLALYLSMRKWGNALILPVSVILAVGAYHLALSTLGMSGEEARAAGLLLSGTAEGGFSPALGPSNLIHIEWTALAMQIPIMLTLVLVALIGTILNLASLEMAANEELDWDREFTASGFASVISGLGGGVPAHIIVPASLRSKLLGAASRLTGVATALVIGSALFVGNGILEMIPMPLVGGILFFAGLGMLDEGLVRSWKRLPWSEYGIILLSFVAITTLGVFEGVSVGMLATLIFFTLRLSRVDPIESRFNLQDRQSSKDRTVADSAILREGGDRVRGYQLRGYIFFGSAYPLAKHLRSSLGGEPLPTCLILDFSNVSGLDFSAVNVLCRIMQAADNTGVQVALSAPPEHLQSGFKRNLSSSVFGSLLIVPDVDSALRHCEDIIIATSQLKADTQGGSLVMHTTDALKRHLEHNIHFADIVEELRDWLSPCDYSEGDILAGTGASQLGLQLLVVGHASAYNSTGLRIYRHGPGSTIWPDGICKGTTTTVVADEMCRTMVLEPSARHLLECSQERLALKFYRFLLSEHFGAESIVVRRKREFDGGAMPGL